MDYKKLAKDFDRVKAKRSNFDNMYQVIGEYVAMNRQDFNGQPSNGEFLVDRIFDVIEVVEPPFAVTQPLLQLLVSLRFVHLMPPGCR